MRKIAYVVLGICCLFCIASCGAKMQGYLGIDANVHRKTDKAVKCLLKKGGMNSSDSSSILVTSVVNLSSLDKTSKIGRILSEYIANTLVDMDYVVYEIRMDKILTFQKKGGEYILTREKKDIALVQVGQKAITGTYTLGKNVLYVSLHLVDLNNNVVQSTYEFDLPLGSELRVLAGSTKYLGN